MKPSTISLRTLSAVVISVLFPHCHSPDPYASRPAGISLDERPGGNRRKQSRYLDEVPLEMEPGIASQPPVYGPDGLPIYETPEDLDRPLPAADMPMPPVPEDEPAPIVEVPPEPPSPPTPSPPALSQPDTLPFGIPIAGKKGFVRSPFTKNNGAEKDQMVDVTGIPTGKKVRCPYTGKIFLVP